MQASPSGVWLFPIGRLNLGFLLRENCCFTHHTFLLGFPTGRWFTSTVPQQASSTAPSSSIWSPWSRTHAPDPRTLVGSRRLRCSASAGLACGRCGLSPASPSPPSWRPSPSPVGVGRTAEVATPAPLVCQDAGDEVLRCGVLAMTARSLPCCRGPVITPDWTVALLQPQPRLWRLWRRRLLCPHRDTPCELI
jgi:hypothetical protein